MASKGLDVPTKKANISPAEKAAAEGCNSMQSFFPPKRKKPQKRGRPKKNKMNKGGSGGSSSSSSKPKKPASKGGRPRGGARAASSSAASSDATKKKQPQATADDGKKKEAKQEKKTRVNWAKKYPGFLRQAQEDWDNKKGMALDPNDDPITDPHDYATLLKIPYQTLYKYIREPKEKRVKIGNGVGPSKTLMTDEEIAFVGDVLVRADRGNKGKDRKDTMDVIQELKPDMNRAQAKRQLDRRVLPVNAANGKTTKGLVKAQATTTERSAITYASQRRWFDFVSGMFDDLRKKNSGSVCLQPTSLRTAPSLKNISLHWAWTLQLQNRIHSLR